MIETLKDTRNLPDSALKELLESPSAALAQELKDTAREVCLKVKGPEVLIRALIEWSNLCRNDCLYCGIPRKRSFNAVRQPGGTASPPSCFRAGRTPPRLKVLSPR